MAARNMIMKVGAVVKMFWNMIAIQAMLGPRKYHCVEGIFPPRAVTINWINPLGSPSQSTFCQVIPNNPKNFDMKKLIYPVLRWNNLKIKVITTEEVTLGA